ncbi:MAG: hypothetical protein HY300_17255 [Verrucomicrobia bacterium]|nr:hypothetical protein [Verrucomicrobiota bacterium]
MKTVSILLALFLAPLAVFAQAKKGDPVTLDTVTFVGDVKPGSNCVAVVNFKIEKGFSIPTSRPAARLDLASQLFVGAAAGVRVFPPNFPAGADKQVKVPGVAQPVATQMYEDTFSIQVPLILGPNTVLPATLPATLAYQPQQNNVRQPVKQLRFEIKLPKPEPPKPAK